MELWILTITSNDGGSPDVEVFTTEKLANDYLAGYCRAVWGSQGHSEPLPADDGEAVAHFFEFWNEGEFDHSLEKKFSDPPPPGDEPDSPPCDSPGCRTASSRSDTHWVNPDHMKVRYWCDAHATPESTPFDDDDDDWDDEDELPTP